MKYIDIHTHLDFPNFDLDREEIIHDMKSQDIGAFNIGTSLESSKNSIALAEKHSHICAIVGVHPIHTNESQLADIDLIESLISHNKCVGIGECGLDFFREADDMQARTRQLSFFEKQIELAIKYNKPLMIHCRKAYPETLEVLESYKKIHPNLHAHFHFFTEPIDTARRILDKGFTVSFTGVITFVPEYIDLVKFVPTNSLMIETDSPYVAPKSQRGKRNDPRNVIEIAQTISLIKEIPLDIFAKHVRDNTKRIFRV